MERRDSVPYDESVTYDLRVYQDGAQVLELPGLPNLFKLQVADVSVAEDTPTNGSILYKDPLSGRLILVLDCLHHSVSRYPGIRPGLITAEVVAKAPGAEDAGRAVQRGTLPFRGGERAGRYDALRDQKRPASQQHALRAEREHLFADLGGHRLAGRGKRLPLAERFKLRPHALPRRGGVHGGL